MMGERGDKGAARSVMGESNTGETPDEVSMRQLGWTIVPMLFPLVWGCSQSTEPVASKSINPAEVYANNCRECHGAGTAGAPIVGNAEAWKPRLAKGLETLIDHAINGFGNMPAKGGSRSLGREQVAQVVRYMADESR